MIQVNHIVYIKNHFTVANKLEPAWLGPYKILCMHTNATLTIKRGLIHECVNI